MQISNQTLLVIGIGAFLVWYFFLNKNEQVESNYGPNAPSCPGGCQWDKRTWNCVCGSKVSL